VRSIGSCNGDSRGSTNLSCAVGRSCRTDQVRTVAETSTAASDRYIHLNPVISIVQDRAPTVERHGSCWVAAESRCGRGRDACLFGRRGRPRGGRTCGCCGRAGQPWVGQQPGCACGPRRGRGLDGSAWEPTPSGGARGVASGSPSATWMASSAGREGVGRGRRGPELAAQGAGDSACTEIIAIVASSASG